MDGIVKFIASIANVFGEAFNFISRIVDVLQAIYRIVISCCSFLPSPFNEMTLFTIGIIFVLIVWRLKR